MSDLGDLIGLLHKNDATGRTEFMRPYWFPKDQTPVVLFIDELNCARPEVKSYRRILWIITSEQDYELSKGWINKLPNNRAIWIPDIKGNRKKGL